MQRRPQGWRTHRWQQAPAAAPAVAPNAPAWTPRAALSQVLSWKPWQHVPFGLAMLGAVLYVFQIHSYKVPFGNLPIALALLGVVISGRVGLNRALVVTGLLVIWAYVMTVEARSVPLSRETAIDFAKVWLVSWAIYNTLRDRYHVRFFIFVWLAFFALYPLRGAYYNQYICNCAIGGRISWNFIFENPNDLASFCFVPMGMCAGVLVTERHKIWRIVSLIGLGACVLLVLLTQSRGAFLALAATGLIVLWRAPNRKRNFKVALLAAVVAVPFAPKGLWDRIAGLKNFSTETNMEGVDEEGSAEGRWRTWMIAVGVIRENPITGVGPGMYKYEHWQISRRQQEEANARGARDAHSTYLLIGAELGLVGLGLFLLAIYLAMSSANKARKLATAVDRPAAEQLLFLQLGFFGFLLAGIFSSFPYLSYTHIYLATLTAFSSALTADVKKTAAFAAAGAAQPRGAAVFRRPAAVRASPRSR